MANTDSGKKHGPIVALAYGPSGIGKTTDMGYSFPTALFLAAPGSLNSIKSVCGYEPDTHYVQTIPEAAAVIVKAGESSHYDTVVIDDFSFMAEKTFSTLERSHNGFKLWGAMRDAALSFRDKSRYAGVNVILNAWEQAPKNKPDGSRLRGGPQLSGKLPESIPALCDVVLRAVHEPQRQPWPAAYRCSADPDYVMKDRFNVASLANPAPMNFAELLRAGGVEVRRRADYPEQEDHVESICENLVGRVKDDAPFLNERFLKLMEQGRTQAEARWTLRDAMDRRILRTALQKQQDTFITVSNTLLG